MHSVSLPNHFDRVHYSTHPTIRNKPPVWDPAYGSGWISEVGPLGTLRTHVTGGGAFIAAAMSSNHRTSAAFVKADLAVVDIDNGLTIEEFLAHPLAAQAAWVYTSHSHDPEAGKHRFRVIFRLPETVTDPGLYKAIATILIRALGGDRSCSDCCRLFYGCDRAEEPLWQPDAVLSSELVADAEDVLRQQAKLYDAETAEVDEDSILKAIFVLEQVIEPTRDGERDIFVRVTAAARAGGDALFPAWSDWASRGHHGKGKNSRQTSERYFRGMNGTSLGTLFYLASESDPQWRKKLPEELRGSGGPGRGRTENWAGYSHEDFMGEPDRPATKEATYGLFSPDAPWAVVAKPAQSDPAPTTSKANAAGYDDADFEGGGDGPIPVIGDPKPKRGPGRPKKGGGKSMILTIKTRLESIYPGLRLNLVTQQLEYGPADRPCPIDDISTAYALISIDQEAPFPKTTVMDVANIIGKANRYHPVRAYLQSCLAASEPCPYFDRLGSELLGLPSDELENPVMPDGSRLGDLVLRRALIGAVARAMNPGCDMDWMPILVGSQNLGKSAFFRYLVPPATSGRGHWVTTLQQGITYLKDRPHTLHCGWIVVLDEIERYFQRRYVEELKNLVSVNVDRSAKKYQNEQSYERSFVLVGATNSTDFLQDPTGNRRFFPVLVKGKVPSIQNPDILIIDLDRLKRDRESIWAAAYQAWLAGETHQFSSSEIAWVERYVAAFDVDSSIESQVARELTRTRTGVTGGRAYITLSDLFNALRIPIETQPRLRQEVTDSLKRLGWVNKRVSIFGTVQRVWLAPLTNPTY